MFYSSQIAAAYQQYLKLTGATIDLASSGKCTARAEAIGKFEGEVFAQRRCLADADRKVVAGEVVAKPGCIVARSY